MSDGGAEQTPPVQTGSPAAADQPRYTLTSQQIEWLRQNHYQRFKLMKGHRGTKKTSKRALSLPENEYANGRDFSDRVVAPAFVKEFHRQWDKQTVETWKASLEKASLTTSHISFLLADLDLRKYFPMSCPLSVVLFPVRVHDVALSQAIYDAFSRLVRREGEQNAKKDAAAYQMGSTSNPKRVYPENEWARANPSAVSEEINNQTGTSSSPGVGVWRHVVSSTFNALPVHKRARWQNATEAKRANQMTLARLPVEERASFVKNLFLKDVRRLANNANVVAGLSLTMTFTYEAIESDGQASHRIEGYTSPSIQEWATTEEYGDHIAQFSSWARDVKGSTFVSQYDTLLTWLLGVAVMGQPPPMATIPDVGNLYRPMYPGGGGQ
ncbi:hypothetical protein RhiJN_25711 [Ceratobasidium sp. AG-Ba]|nr:hypothetical protein RhiJN_25711 [Ceratobasidium sp. AG-Ba]